MELIIYAIWPEISHWAEKVWCLLMSQYFDVSGDILGFPNAKVLQT